MKYSRQSREHPPYPLAASEALSLNIIIPWGSEGKGLGKMHQSSVVYTTARAQPKLKKVIRVLLIGFAHSMDAFLRTVAIFPSEQVVFFPRLVNGILVCNTLILNTLGSFDIEQSWIASVSFALYCLFSFFASASSISGAWTWYNIQTLS